LTNLSAVTRAPHPPIQYSEDSAVFAARAGAGEAKQQVLARAERYRSAERRSLLQLPSIDDEGPAICSSQPTQVALPQELLTSKQQSAMLYRSLGNTGLRVSEIGFGCASYWGKKVFDEAAAIRLIHTAIDHGVTLFDTGASYSGGNAEPRLGRALAGLKNKHDLVIATKAGSYTDEQGKWREDFSPSVVRRTVEASLIRLGLDAIPLLQLHGPEIAHITDDLLDTLARLRDEGKVLHLSVNSFEANVIEHIMTLPLFGTVMIDYNILRPEREPVMARLAARKLGILAGMALGGSLHSKERFRIRGVQDVWYIARIWKNHRADLKRARNLRFIDDEPGLTGAEIALAWVLRKPEISCAMIGTTRMSHLLVNLQASGQTLGGDLLENIRKAQRNFA
jgi:aryl-alcohol dehydrogenase-like predicted oxidoreductase